MMRDELLTMLGDDRIAIPTDKVLKVLKDMDFFAECPPQELLDGAGDNLDMRRLIGTVWRAGYRAAIRSITEGLLPRSAPVTKEELATKMREALDSWKSHPKYGEDVLRGDVIELADHVADLATDMLAMFKKGLTS